jgi:hydrogenase/urease accessory protein HupE
VSACQVLAAAASWPAVLLAHPEAPIVLPRLGLDAPSTLELLVQYGRLGVEHLAGGLDHVLFVLALVLLATSARRLVATVTAFTLGHSLTLAASALGVLALPSAWAEIGIALTLVVVALQVLDDDGAHAHGPLLAGAFGLVHGLGFSTALGEIGLPAGARVPALLGFNVGVELGQLAVVLVAWPLQHALERHAPRGRALSRIALGYAIGALAFMWMLERLCGA